MTSNLPAQYPPEPPPRPLPRVEMSKSISFTVSPQCSRAPQPVLPKIPTPWQSSIIIKALNFQQIFTSLWRSGISPSIENTPSVTTNTFSYFPLVFLKSLSRSSKSLCLKIIFFAWESQIPSMMEA